MTDDETPWVRHATTQHLPELSDECKVCLRERIDELEATLERRDDFMLDLEDTLRFASEDGDVRTTLSRIGNRLTAFWTTERER